MSGTTLQIILFFVLAGEGALTRLAYIPLAALQRKNSSKLFGIVSDILVAVIGCGIMLLTCLILSDSVRVFYAVFFLGGGAIAHLLIKPKITASPTV